MRILIVEDEPVLADGLTRSLRHADYAVDCSGNGAEADHVLAAQGSRWRGGLNRLATKGRKRFSCIDEPVTARRESVTYPPLEGVVRFDGLQQPTAHLVGDHDLAGQRRQSDKCELVHVV